MANYELIRIASEMIQLVHAGGDDAAGASYLELMEFILRHGATIEKDLEKL